MQTHSVTRGIAARFKAYRIDRQIRNAGGEPGPKLMAGAQRDMAMNNLAMRGGTESSPQEVRFVLVDYRNGNRVLAGRTMDRLAAYELNERLAGTGFAWSCKTGY